MNILKFSPITRRLMPLYVAAFLQGIPFWYAIEKLFMLDIGFNTISIGVMVAVMSVVMLVVETPSGILADRWSRRGVMALGALSLLISGLLGGISNNQPLYILSTVFWGIYGALYSGTYDAVIYDTVVEDYGNSSNFEKYLGRFKAVEGIAFIIGAFGGGWIASSFTMRHTYILSLPLILLAFYFLFKFREPKIHKVEVAEPVFLHIQQTFAAVLKKPVLLPVVIATVGFATLQETIFELSQLWFIAAEAPLATYGLFSAAIFSSWSTGGLLAARIKSRASTTIPMTTIVACLLGLIFTQDYRAILALQFLLAMCLVALSVILAKKMHDELPSRLRAGSSSVVGTLSRATIVPVSVILTTVAYRHNIFLATYLLLGIAAVAIFAYACINYSKGTRTKKA